MDAVVKMAQQLPTGATAPYENTSTALVEVHAEVVAVVGETNTVQKKETEAECTTTTTTPTPASDTE